MNSPARQFLGGVILTVGVLTPLVAFAVESQTSLDDAKIPLSLPAAKTSPAPPAMTSAPLDALPKNPSEPCEQDTPAVVPAPDSSTITLTTGGGNKINERWIGMFSKTKWRLNYPDAPGVELMANQALASDGYDVEKKDTQSVYGWHVQTVHLGDPDKYVPPSDGNEEVRANVERGGRLVSGLLVTLLSAGRINGSNIATGQTSNSPYAKYLTKDMVSGVPPGARKMLLTRLMNPVYRAQQEILTVAYTDISDEELRRINAVPMLDMVGINLNGEKKNETTQ